MLKLYHAPRTRSVRVIWLCEEMGVPYEIVPFSVTDEAIPGLNPALTVPILIDGDHVLTESVTMLEYIAETYGPTPLALTSGDPDYWDYKQFLLFGEASLAAIMAPVIATVMRAPKEHRENWTVDLIRTRFAKRLEVVSKQLSTLPYIAGEAFTLADIAVVYMINMALNHEMFGMKHLVPDDIVAYRDRLAQRPAFQRAMEV